MQPDFQSDASLADRSPPAAERFRTGTGLLCLTAAMCLLLSPEFGKELSRAAALLLVLTWSLLTSRNFELRRLASAAGVLLALGLGLVHSGDTDFSRAIGACLSIGSIAALWRDGRAAAQSLCIASALVALGCTAWLASPWLFEPVATGFLGWSRAVGKVFGRDWSIGPSFQGGRIAAVCVALLLARFAIVEWRPWRVLAGLAWIAVGSWLQMAAYEWLTGPSDTPWIALSTWCVLGSITLVSTSILVSRPSTHAQSSDGGALRWAPGLFAVLALAIGLNARVVHPKTAPTIGFYRGNLGEILDFERPIYGSYGNRSLGLFGLLTERLTADGFDVEYVDGPLTPESLEGLDALVTINVNTTWTEDELVAAWSYVHAGGNLLVIGDHTNVDNSRGSQNDLLAPTGIEFQFDSAFPASPNGWGDSDLYLHPLNVGLTSLNELDIGIGASLKLLKFGAEPVAVGRHGLADAGDAAAPERAYLGDYSYQPGEQLGDTVLIAWAPLGAGKVLVFADSSSFQNVPMESTYDPHLRRLFDWLTGETALDLGVGGAALCDVLFMLLAAVVLVRARADWRSAGLFVLLMWAVVQSCQFVDERRLRREPLELPSVLFDDSHLARTDSGERGLDGLKNTVIRSGYTPVTAREFPDRIADHIEVFVTVAPVEPYSAEELQTLQAFMERGGFVVACAGYPDREGLLGLLELAGLEVLPRAIGPIPLKRPPGRARVRVEYVDAWQVAATRVDESEPPWVYGAYEGLPLSILVRQGQGGLFFVGDSAFFGSGNLEFGQEFSEPNLLFVRSLLADFKNLRAGSVR